MILRKNPGAGLEGFKSMIDEQRRPIVLIVDDQFTGRKILQQLIHSIDKKLQIKCFSDPFEALGSAAQQVPDLVLTDYKMPDLDGVDFIRRFRTTLNCSDVPLVMVTVVDDPEVRYQALDAGATDFLVRPIDQHECRARCKNLLILRRQQKIIKNRASWLEEQVSAATLQIRNRERETLLRLARAVEYRDAGTGNHVLRMAKYSRLIAEQLGLSALECEEIELAAPMHDIGKIGIPDNILLKPARLNPAERRVMNTHTLIGHEILKDSPSRYLQLGAVIALAHHEKFDGSGYPKGLQDNAIPLYARIVAVADVYDALTTARPYKSLWSSEDSIEFICQQMGRHFDPQCTKAFISQIDAVREIETSLQDEPS
ncbi:MAG: response regulator [Gammaproteobacteria bacterium]|nr:response regulator [Gammaproteobacteria bacterium]